MLHFPFCPRRSCINHQSPPAECWYRPYGVYHTKAYGTVKRYACRKCGKSFSRRTFHLSYYLHLTISFHDILVHLATYSGIRSIAKVYGVTDKVVVNRIGRLARQAIGMIADLRPTQKSIEDLTVESRSDDILRLIGTTSRYVHACDLARNRWNGRVTDRHNEQSGISLGLHASFERICLAINDFPQASETVVLHTDDKKEYRVMLEANRYLDGQVQHSTTPSRTALMQGNPLQPVDDEADCFRESTHRSPEANNRMEWTYAHAGYHNFYKPFRIKKPDTRTHAEVAGFDAKEIELRKRRFYTERYFYTKVTFNASEWLVWLRGYQTQWWQELPKYVTGEERRNALPWAA